MSLMVRALFPRDHIPGIKGWFGVAYADYVPLYSQIFDVRSDDRAYAEFALLSGLPLLQQMDEGQSVTYASGKQGYVPRFDHIKMALGFMISQEQIEDGISLNVAQRMSKMLKLVALKSDEVIAHQVLNRATTGSGAGLMTNGDGVALLSTAHPIRGSGATNTFSNRAAVDTDLSEAALEQAIVDIGNFVDDRGNRIMAKPQKLVVHLSEQFNAQRILKSENRVGTTDNDINALKSMGILQSMPVVSPYLTDLDQWFITTDVEDGLIFFDRKSAVIDSDNDFDTNSGKYKVVRRLSVGWGDPRGIYGSPGA